ncbi:MAG TPA: lipocalin-like domain-containing protein [Thermoanaerobaculia bacterium]|nr:lipocalin-like domain-containing protein [Thermoanaerobaculia bacterium]
MRRTGWGLIAVALAFVAVYLLTRSERPLAPRASLSVAGALRTGNEQGYARAIEPREFHFPADHGPHPEFRTEWWYYTGNLETAEGRRFGFQLTFFRSALAPEMGARESAWATRQAWLAHFTVSDVAGGRFHSFERWSRGAVGLAGARAEPFRVWVRDWSAAAVGEQAPPMRLAASEGEVGIDLVLQPGKPPVLQGDRGLSRKSSEIGNASYYYSLTRMPAAGAVRLGGERFAVTGLAWMDREWSTSSLGRDQVGWDWFALQLSDGSDLMLYRLRRQDGAADPASSGTVVAPSGEARHLRLADFQIAPSGEWRSPRSGARYPARWRLRIPAEELDLEVRPLLADQELDVSFRYWEGAVEIAGTRRGRPVGGRGYVELTGYAAAGHR